MKQPSKPFSNLRLLGLVLCGLVLSPYSYSQEVVTGPFLIRDGITYDQNTNEPFTGIVEEFHDNGQLEMRENFIDGELDGLFEYFDEDGNLTETRTYRNGEMERRNLNP